MEMEELSSLKLERNACDITRVLHPVQHKLDHKL
jgi:hypothetical protein